MKRIKNITAHLTLIIFFISNTATPFVPVSYAQTQLPTLEGSSKAPAKMTIKSAPVPVNQGPSTKGDSTGIPRTPPTDGKGKSKTSVGGGQSTSTMGSKSGSSLRSGSAFKKGFDPDKDPSWTKWTTLKSEVIAPKTQTFIKRSPRTKKKTPRKTHVRSLSDQYFIAPKESPEIITGKINKLVKDLGDKVYVVSDALSSNTSLLSKLIDSVDVLYSSTDKMFSDINLMFKDIKNMYRALDGNYTIINKYKEITPQTADDFNSTSDAMADRTLGMIAAVEGMAVQHDSATEQFDDKFKSLDEMTKATVGKKESVKQLERYVKEADTQSKTMISALKKKGGDLGTGEKQVEDYFKKTRKYVKESKDYAESTSSDIDNARTYLGEVKGFLKKTRSNLDKSIKDLKWEEKYFRNAKIQPNAEEKDACQTVGLQVLGECKKDCRTVCKWKERVGVLDCYECPSPNSDTCYDVGALPANHPWCHPSGVCYEYAEFVCDMFPTVGPTGTELTCARCRERPDECPEHFDNTMMLTGCINLCLGGTCEYRGDYEVYEWDDKEEYIHCYECVGPAPPPTCEEMQWGFSTKAACVASCPAPGICDEVKMTMAGPAEDDDDDDGDDGDDGDDDGEEADAGGGGVTQDEDIDDGDDSDDINQPPTPAGTAEQPSSGSDIAGLYQAADQADEIVPMSAGDKPDGTAPKQPAKPKGKKPELTAEKPPEAPVTPEITAMTARIADLNEKINKRQAILDDEDTGTETREEAYEQLQRYETERDELKEKLKVALEQAIATEAKTKADAESAQAYQDKRTQARAGDKTQEEIIKALQLRDLQESVKNLRDRAKAIQSHVKDRRKTLRDLDGKITKIKKDLKENKSADYETEEEAQTLTREQEGLESELRKLWILRSQMAAALAKEVDGYDSEITKLKSKALKNLWAYNERARQNTDISRLDEYIEWQTKLRRIEKQREVSDKAFKDKFDELITQIKEAKAKDDTKTADDLQRQLKNMERGKAEWDDLYQRRYTSIKKVFDEIKIRNGIDGVGPDNDTELKAKIGEYSSLIEQDLEALKSARDKIKADIKAGRLATSVDKDGNESTQTLDRIEQRIEYLTGALESLTEHKNFVENEYRLTEEDVEAVTRSAGRVADGSRNRDEAESFASVYAKELANEFARTFDPLDPRVRLKKAFWFAVGTVEGVYSAISGLAQLAYGVNQLAWETAAKYAGFKEGGIFGNEASAALQSVLSSVSENADLDGVVNALVFLGGLITNELERMERSGDIDKATSRTGGKVFGDVVVGDVIIGAAFGKAAQILKSSDEAASAAAKADDVAKGTLVRRGPDGKVVVPDVKSPDLDLPKTTGAVDDVAIGKATRPKTDAPEGKSPAKKPPTRGPPDDLKPTRVYDNTKPLPDTGVKPKQLADDVLTDLEKNHGFRKDHAQAMSEFAQEKGVFVIMRDGNPDCVRYMDNPDYMAKPMSSKAKTAKAGPKENKGLVVNPFHHKQAAYWDADITKAKAAGDTKKVEWLQENRLKAETEWTKYGEKMKKEGYSVNQDTGIVEYTDPVTGKHYKGVHGDYDLHGVYRKSPDRGMESVSFGDGVTADANGFDIDGKVMRRQFNQKIDPGKDYCLHGGQDSWIPDPKYVPVKKPDPPVVVFPPTGPPPVKLKDAAAMKTYYENVMKVPWPY